MANENAKKGSAEEISEPEQVQYKRLYAQVCSLALFAYERMIEDGVCPEQARFVLPQGMETSWIWTGSLAAYSRFCKQRMDSHAQKEVRELAGLVSDIVGGLFPISWRELVHPDQTYSELSRADGTQAVERWVPVVCPAH